MLSDLFAAMPLASYALPIAPAILAAAFATIASRYI